LTWPGELACCQDLCPEHDLGRVLEARDALMREAGLRLSAELHERFTALHAALPPGWGLETSGRRAWKNAMFHLWARQGGEAVRALAATWYAGATNMTDRLAALSVLCRETDAAREAALGDFLDSFGADFTMLTTWFSVQASAGAPDTFDRVRGLMSHPAFDWANPNKVRALLRTFAANLRHFHRPDGAGYVFVADAVRRLNGLNPHLAAGLVGAFSQTGLLDPPRLALVRGVLADLARTPGLHAQVLEQVNRILG
jgi:aminopeptidase N